MDFGLHQAGRKTPLETKMVWMIVELKASDGAIGRVKGWTQLRRVKVLGDRIEALGSRRFGYRYQSLEFIPRCCKAQRLIEIRDCSPAAQIILTPLFRFILFFHRCIQLPPPPPPPSELSS